MIDTLKEFILLLFFGTCCPHNPIIVLWAIPIADGLPHIPIYRGIEDVIDHSQFVKIEQKEELVSIAAEENPISSHAPL